METKECRICLSDENQKNLIAPCLCKGSSRWVHRQCLDQWRAAKSMKDAFTHCGTCKFKYVVKTRIDKTAETQLRRYRLLVARDSIFAIISIHLFICVLAIILQHILPKGPLILIEQIDAGGKVVSNNSVSTSPVNSQTSITPTPEIPDPGFWHFYFLAIILFFFLLGITYIFLSLCTNYLPENMWLPNRFYRPYYGWNFDGNILFFLIVLLIILGLLMAIGIGAYLIERLMSRHYKITWLLEETQKYIVTDLSTDEEQGESSSKLAYEQETSNEQDRLIVQDES